MLNYWTIGIKVPNFIIFVFAETIITHGKQTFVPKKSFLKNISNFYRSTIPFKNVSIIKITQGVIKLYTKDESSIINYIEWGMFNTIPELIDSFLGDWFHFYCNFIITSVRNKSNSSEIVLSILNQIKALRLLSQTASIAMKKLLQELWNTTSQITFLIF